MKILMSVPLRNNPEGGDFPNPIHTLPDTALLGAKAPFFIPDFAPCCTANLYLAVRINRLGRSIFSKFAHRYYDAVAPAVHFTANPFLGELQDRHLPWDMACGFDNALAVGSFTPVAEAIAEDNSVHCEIARNGKAAITNTFCDTRNLIAEFIHVASHYYMLRQGDILLFPANQKGFDVDIDDRIEASLNGAPALAFNIK